MRTKLLLWLIALPLILSCYGGWQLYRVSGLSDTVTEIRSINSYARTAVAADPQATIEIDGEAFSATSVLSDTNAWLYRNSTEIGVIRLQSPLVYLSIGGALLSLLLGGSALWLCVRSGLNARKSRDELLAVFNRCRRLLPFIMVGQMALVGLSVFALMVYELGWLINNVKMTGGGAKLFLIVGLSALAILYYILKGMWKLKQCFVMFEATPSNVQGKIVTEQDAPGLWQWINQLSAKVGATPPDNIIVGLTECFYVTSYPVNVNDQQVVSGRTLYFPLIYAALLNREESSAVIGHELGHFTGEDTTYSLNFAPIYAGMERSIDVMIENVNGADDYYARLIMSPSIYLGIFFIQQFDYAVNHWSRIREYAADQVGANASSPQAIASSLLRISAVNEQIDKQLGELYKGKLKTDDLLPIIIDSLREEGIPQAGQFLENEFSHPTDSHPTTRARLEALNQPVDQALLDNASRQVDGDYYDNISDLFVDAKALSMELTHSISGVIDEYYQEQTQVWQQQVASVSEAVVLTESKAATIFFSVLSVFFLGLTAALAANSIEKAGGTIHMMSLINSVVGGVLAVSVICILLSLMMKKRLKGNTITITPTSISSSSLPQGYPLHYLADYGLKLDQYVGTLTLYIADNAPLPELSKNLSGGFILNPKKRTLTFQYFWATIANGKKISDEKLSETIFNHFQAAHANQALNR